MKETMQWLDDGQPVELPLSYLAVKSGRTMKQIYKHLRITRRTWNKWISGVDVPTREQQLEMARLFNTHICIIIAAIRRNRTAWLRDQEYLERINSKKSDGSMLFELAVSIIASIATSLIVTLVMLGKV